MPNKSAKKNRRKKRPNINQIRSKIRQIAENNSINEEVLLGLAEFVNGGKFKPVEPKMVELKSAIISEFGYSKYAELKKDGNFQLFIQDNKLNLRLKSSWIKIYRRFVGLPDSERDAIGSSSINGVDVLRNFLPWKVFNLDPSQASEREIKSAFNELAKKHHPDVGGNPAVFQELKSMRDTLLAAYK